MRAQNAPLRRPRTLFTIALCTLGITVLLTYERITSSTLSLFQWPYRHPVDLALTDQERTQKAIFDDIGPMSYGTAHRPPIKGLPKHLVADLPDPLVPAVGAEAAGHVDRLVIIGDVHGHKRALEHLLEKLHFDVKSDSLVFTGDMINKGPDSAGVVELAMELGAHSVRGNHEDRVLLVHHAMTAADATDADAPPVDDADPPAAALETLQIRDGNSEQHESQQDLEAARKEYLEAERHLTKGDKRAREVARSLSHKQTKWLSELPLILRIGAIPRNAKHPAFENMLVVHAGLVPSVALADQDPWAVMNMRTISHPIDELRRDAVKNFLLERAKRLPGGKVAALQAVDGLLVDEELAKILEAQGLDGDDLGAVALPSSGREGTYWYEEWSKHQERLVKEDDRDRKKDKKDKHQKGGKSHKKHRDEDPITTVVYGHDAKSGLRVPKELGKGKKGYTFGLDSGCVYGGKLSALVVEVRDGQAVHEIVQVDCAQHVDPDE